MKFSKLQAAATSAAVALAMAPGGIVRATSYDGVSDTAAVGILAGLGGFILVLVLLGLASFIFWLVMLIDAFQRNNWQDDSQKNLWLILLIVSFLVGFNFVVAVVYYFVVRRPLGKGTEQVVQEAEVVKTPAAKPTKKK